jgi:DNA (cytosine-5)-methyltransferase 1
MKPRLLDLFCGAGGAGMGYHRAGFEVVGVDIEPQKNYPFEFHQGDALEYLAEHGHEFDVIHASPPCQAYSDTYSLPNVGEYPELISPVRALLLAIGKPYVIENVDNAPLDNPLMLCGTMFGLRLIRHRLFECRPPVWFPPGPCQCRHLYTNSARGFSSFDNGATAITVAGNNYPLKDGAVAMGIDWMTNRGELSEAIPPAYTEFIGAQLLQAVQK